ncbi:MAG: aminopeptidase [Acidobacteriota bacterium]
MRTKLLVFFMTSLAMAGCQAPGPQSSNSMGSNGASTANGAKPDAAKPAAPTDMKALAAKIVNQSAGVKEGEIVLISGSIRDMDLLENIVTEVQKVGGDPLLSISSEKIAKRSFTDVPDKYDSQEPKLGMALAKTANVTINVDSSETENLLADIPPARMAARAKASSPVGAESVKNKVRSVNVGNDLYPTEWRAKRFDMPLDAFAKLFWEGVNIDYTNLQATGEKARAAMAGKEIEITHPNGTSLKGTLESKPAYISDGIISDDDVSKGSTQVFLPAGEAAVIPAAGSGSGKFVIEKDYFQGKEMHNVVLNFENGKITSMTGEGDGFAAMKASYDAFGEGKDALSYIDIGINPNYTLAPTSKYGNWVSAGMVSIGTGNNIWAGGSNNAAGAAGGHLAGCTVKIDGKIIVENGVLKL